MRQTTPPFFQSAILEVAWQRLEGAPRSRSAQRDAKSATQRMLVSAAATIVGILAQRRNEIKQLGELTLRGLDELVLRVREHSEAGGLTDQRVESKATKHQPLTTGARHV